MNDAPVTDPDEPASDPMSAMDPEMARCPQPVFKALRAETPVLAMDGMGVVLTTRALIDEALRHPEIYSSNMDAVDLQNVRPMIPLQIDPPEHKKYRKILDPLFAPKQMAVLEEPVTQLVNDLIDGSTASGRSTSRRSSRSRSRRSPSSRCWACRSTSSPPS